jgi:hypothetical protein
MLVIKLFTVACLAVVVAAWIAESYSNGNRVWVKAHEIIDNLYEQVYLAAWVAMMRHAADPAYSYEGKHFRGSRTAQS